ncbi:MAG: alpha/beta hydrolase [Acidimicrobiales bacterium]
MPYAFDPQLALRLPPAGTPTASADLPSRRAERTKGILEADPPDLTGVVVENLEVPGVSGQPAVALRLYRPAEDRGPKLPCVYTMFGGGFMVGHIDDTEARNARWCRELGAVVAAVSYRLAPDHRYPAAVDDCYAGFCGLIDRAGELGIDPSRVALFGISAGGGLAAALTLRARDQGGPSACFQFLSVPELDDRLETPSARNFVDTPVWNRPRAEVSWELYLGRDRDDRTTAAYAAPARATDLSGLPPAYIAVMQFDPLRDEGIAYAQALMDSGVRVELHMFPGAFHGSYRIREAVVSKRELTEQVEVLRTELFRKDG